MIDAPAFHGAPPRARLRARTAAFLGVTLRAIEDGARGIDPTGTTSPPRARLAAWIGRRARALAATPERLDALLALVRDGWATQVDGVCALTASPATVDRAEVARVTRRISGDWVAILAAVGALVCARRGLTAREIEAIRDFGAPLQRADALADVHKDAAAGLRSTWAACALHDRGVEAWPLLPFEASPSVSERARLAEELGGLGGLFGRLAWIHAMLLGRAPRELPLLPQVGPVRSAEERACSAR